MTGLSYVGEQVRRYDHDRFVTAIFASKHAREHLFALYAFNIEIAKIGEVVTEPLIGRIRLQWWRDTLDRLYAGNRVAHGVAAPLGNAILTCRLERTLFDRLIAAREFDLDGAPPQDLSALEIYAEYTSAPLLELALSITAGSRSDSAEVARLTGKAWALTGLLRAVPFHARQRRCYLPSDLLAAGQVPINRLYDLKSCPELIDIASKIGERARSTLMEARISVKQRSRADRSPLLLLPLALRYLHDLEGVGWDPFLLEQRTKQALPMVSLAVRAALGRY